jgi:hypothetical protein
MHSTSEDPMMEPRFDLNSTELAAKIGRRFAKTSGPGRRDLQDQFPGGGT